MKKHLPIILLNFSGVYDYESFASSQDIIHVDCRGLNGVDITGECSATLDYLSEVKEASVNNKTNEELMQMILSESV